MKTKKKRMSNRIFIALWAPFLALSLGVAIALEVVAPGYKTFLDTYAGRISPFLGKGDMVKNYKKGTENWNKDYYVQSFPSGSKGNGSKEAMENAERLVEEIASEGMVLLKNKDNALPLEKNSKIALLGRGSADPIYGGSGSGNVDTSRCLTPFQALKNAGFQIDEDVYRYFSNQAKFYPRQNIKMDDYQASTFFIGEINPKYYQKDFAGSKNTTAVVFISRGGGEGLDLSTNLKKDATNRASKNLMNGKGEISLHAKEEINNYKDNQHELELSKEEQDMLSFAKKNYAKTIVILNFSTTMEIHSLKDDPEIDGIIWAGSPGSTGFNALGKILNGSVNPSGKTPDLYAASFADDPSFQNFARNGEHQYKDVDDIDKGIGKEAHFVQYEEGIYLGYRYYETRYGKDEEEYQKRVTYPFGYGLSYTAFEKTLVSSKVDEENVELIVKVTNVGSRVGKEVVQAYCSTPYINGGIEKASTVLVGFEKTKLLNPLESEEVTIKIKKEDLASYDYNDKNNNGFKGYELEKGRYEIEIKEDSHTVSLAKDSKLLSISFDIEKTKTLRRRNSDAKDVYNQFDDVSDIFKTAKVDGYGYLMSRSDFDGSFPTSPTEKDTISGSILVDGKSVKERLKPYQIENDNNDVAPKMNEKGDLSLIDVRGLDYDHPKYDKLLNQLTEADYRSASDYLVAGAYNTPAMPKIHKPYTEDHDGPQGFTSLFSKYENFAAYMSEPLLAATFSKKLAKEMGKTVGEEALAANPSFSGWYGPGMNTHRSPFSGRNFEYYSEDGFLAGKIAANVVSGALDKGLYTYIKHFALNDQETFRVNSLCTWADEQTIREIYLKPFEIVVKEAKAEIDYIVDDNGNHAKKPMNASTAVMSSFNRIGCTWAGGRKTLMTNVLRDEWGFRGFAISDFNLFDYMNPDQAIRAGTDMQLTWLKKVGMPFGKEGSGLSDTTSATALLALRAAFHNVFYTIANSNAMQGVVKGTIISYKPSGWRIILSLLNGALITFSIAGGAWILYRTVRFAEYKKEQDSKLP